ncbi:MAG: hypothetical protein ABSF26_01695 [Thermoguttaceae bacterium]|jgi:hypothetical protein
MTSQFERSFDDLVEGLPELDRIERAELPGDLACFVAILGFERRSVAAGRALVGRGVRAEYAIGVRYTNDGMDFPNMVHTDEFASTLRALTGGPDPAWLAHDDHNLESDFGEALLSGLQALGLDLDSELTHIGFDITVGSSRLLLEGLHALLGTRIRVTVFYSESSTYRPRFEEYQAQIDRERPRRGDPPEFLTQGVDRVEILRRIPGQDADSRPVFLVVLPSFACTRVSAVIEELSPSRVQWAFGVPHLVKNRWRLDAQREYHATLTDKSHRHCYVSTFDYRETLTVLENIYRKRRQTYSVFVCSLGSKLQKLGQAIFHRLRPEVAAVVAIPRVWDPENYSDDQPRAIYAVHLGNCRRLVEELWSTKRLRL